jgi:hypothetical protein
MQQLQQLSDISPNCGPDVAYRSIENIPSSAQFEHLQILWFKNHKRQTANYVPEGCT